MEVAKKTHARIKLGAWRYTIFSHGSATAATTMFLEAETVSCRAHSIRDLSLVPFIYARSEVLPRNPTRCARAARGPGKMGSDFGSDPDRKSTASETMLEYL